MTTFKIIPNTTQNTVIKAVSTISDSAIGLVPIPGPQGPQGIQGIQGPTGPALNPTAVRWSPTFSATGLTFTGTNSTYPTYNSYYVKAGQMVTFWIQIDLNTVTNFGTGQFKVMLPFAPLATASNHFAAWAWVNPALPADDLNGHIQVMADHITGSQTLDLHWLVATTSMPKPVIESTLSQGNPVTFTTASKMYINGTYISAS